MSRTSKSKRKLARGAAQHTIVPAATEPVIEDIELEQLAERIRNAHHNVMKHAANAVMTAMDAGDDLKMAKAKAGHDHWMDWLEKNCALSDRTARVYIQLAKNREIIEARIKAATEIQAATNSAIMAERCQFSISRALGWLKDHEDKASTSASGSTTIGSAEKEESGSTTIGSAEKEEPKHVSEISPEELLAMLRPPNWPPAKVVKLGELIAAQFKPSENCGSNK